MNSSTLTFKKTIVMFSSFITITAYLTSLFYPAVLISASFSPTFVMKKSEYHKVNSQLYFAWVFPFPNFEPFNSYVFYHFTDKSILTLVFSVLDATYAP